MILIALGANLPSPAGPPRATCEAAVAVLQAHGVALSARSPWYASAPVPASDQPWFVNGVIRVRTGLSPSELLALLHRVERAFGRRRTVRNAARPLDLDLLAYGKRATPGGRPALPHPRMADRRFVLFPLRDVAPGWRHPVTGEQVDTLLARLPDEGAVRRLGWSSGSQMPRNALRHLVFRSAAKYIPSPTIGPGQSETIWHA